MGITDHERGPVQFGVPLLPDQGGGQQGTGPDSRDEPYNPPLDNHATPPVRTSPDVTCTAEANRLDEHPSHGKATGNAGAERFLFGGCY